MPGDGRFRSLRSGLAPRGRRGADLYLAQVPVRDFEPVWNFAPEAFHRWLDGLTQSATAARRRIRLAGSIYISLAEVLLNRDPVRGVAVWKATREAMTVRYVGSGGVEQLIHVLFTALDSGPVNELRDALLSLQYCATDEALRNLAYAAAYNNREDWIRAKIAEDSASPFAWRQRRAKMLEGALTNNALPIEGAWSEGWGSSDLANLATKAAQRRLREASSRHWWREFLGSTSAEAAYAAWILFLQTCDERSWLWIGRDVEGVANHDILFDRKMAHAEVNHSDIERKAKNQDKDKDKEFLDARIVKGIGPVGSPWRRGMTLAPLPKGVPVITVWPPTLILLILLSFLLFAMIISAVFRYRFSASFWKFNFEPGLAPKDVMPVRRGNRLSAADQKNFGPSRPFTETRPTRRLRSPRR